ncbi:MAG: RNA-guided pseudouridylation complex pseudouridine synthase subunit Cbf5 [archaeon]
MKPQLNFSLINIDKPSGPTSFQISDFVRKSLNLKKTSHMGTLDPQVTGVLPITLGRACKLSQYFMHKEKTYVGVMRLHSEVPLSTLNIHIKNVIGKITQLPPVRSAVKRAPRQRTIHSFKILEKKDKDVLFETQVEAGTYIRKLIHDLGEKIGGAHMLELRRTKAGIFDESTAVTLYEFESLIQNNQLHTILVPAEEAIKKVLPEIQLKEDNLKQLLDGKPLMKSDIKTKLPKEEIFATFLDERFIAIYRKVQEGDIIAKAEFVYN